MRSSYLGAALAATLCLSPLPLLAATQAELAQAEQLLAAKKPLDAFRLLEKAHDPATATTQEYFLLGVAAKQAGKLQKAEGYLLKARELEPSAGRIRLELAEVQYGLGKYDASRSELLAVRAMNPPPQVRQNIDGFIAQVDATKADPRRAPKPKKNWSAFITTGLMSDSNVNGGPDTSTVFLYGPSPCQRMPKRPRTRRGSFVPGSRTPLPFLTGWRGTRAPISPSRITLTPTPMIP
jgi:tetratricopeptide (TPR) repeat protein